MPEEQAFCVLVKIMYYYRLRDLYKNNFEDLHCKFYQLERLMQVSDAMFYKNWNVVEHDSEKTAWTGWKYDGWKWVGKSEGPLLLKNFLPHFCIPTAISSSNNVLLASGLLTQLVCVVNETLANSSFRIILNWLNRFVFFSTAYLKEKFWQHFILSNWMFIAKIDLDLHPLNPQLLILSSHI